MDDKKLTEKESLELISQMIRATKDNMEKGSGNLFLIWGYLSTFVALMIYTVWITTGNHLIFWAWWLIPIIGYPAILYMNRKKEKRVKTDIDRIISHIWIVAGVCAIVSPIVSLFVQMPILFIEALIINMTVAMTGLIIRYKLISISGVIGIALSYCLLFVAYQYQILIFAGMFVVLMVIPGHVLNAVCARKNKKQGISNV